MPAIVRFDALRHVDQLDQPDVRCHLLGGTGTGCAESPAHSQHLWPAAQDVQNLASASHLTDLPTLFL